MQTYNEQPRINSELATVSSKKYNNYRNIICVINNKVLVNLKSHTWFQPADLISS